MINENGVIRETYPIPATLSPISWSAIFTGALVAIGLGFLLNLFAVATGLSAFTLSDTGASVLAIGGFLGLLIGIIASMLASGYAAGYLGHLYRPGTNLGIVYGFSTWTLALLLSALVALPLGHYMTNYHDTLTKTTSLSVTTDKTADSLVKTVSVEKKATATPVKPNEENAAVKAPVSTVVWSAFAIFSLFFIGALASCLGACWGMNCCHNRKIH